MCNTLEELMIQLGIAKYPKRWEGLFDRAVSEASNLDILKENYLTQLNNEYSVFPSYFDTIIRAAEEIRRSYNLSVFVTLLTLAMEDRKLIYKDMESFEPPLQLHGEGGVGADIAMLFPYFRFVEDMISYLKHRNVPESVVSATVHELEYFISEGIPVLGRPLMTKTYFSWGQLFVDHRIIRIERFNLEFSDHCRIKAAVFRSCDGDIIAMPDKIMIHRSGHALGSSGFEDDEGSYYAEVTQTDDYFEGYGITEDGRCTGERIRLPKDKYRKVLSYGDPVINIHIPSFDDLSPDYCTHSFEIADRILKECFTDFQYRGYVCHSWLLEPQLKDLLKPGSNIVSFRNRFTIVPTKSDDKAVFANAFNRLPVDDYSKLEPKTSLERNIKEHYLAGKHLYEYNGFFFI